MTPMPGSGSRPHSPLMHVAVVTWLLLISGAVAINHVTLSGLATQVETSAPSLQVAVLEKRLAELIQQVEHAQQQPVALPQARYEADRLAMEQRLNAIEASLGNQPAADDLLPLQARLEQLEMRLSAPPPAPPISPRPRAAVSAKPKAVEPPFRVIGTELRAGWHLDAIESNTAVFRHGGDSRRLPLPAR